MDAGALTILYGTDEPPSVPRRFRAGPLDVEFEAGTLRHLWFGGEEVLHGVAFLVRDTGWGTYRPAITDLDVLEEPGLFRIRYRALCSGPEGRFAYCARIEGHASGALDAPALNRMALLDHTSSGARADPAWLDAASPLGSDRTLVLPPFAVARLLGSDAARGT